MLDNKTLDAFAKNYETEGMARDHARAILETSSDPEIITFFIPPMKNSRGKILSGPKTLAHLDDDLIQIADECIADINASVIPDNLKKYVEQTSGSKGIEFGNFIRARPFFAAVYDAVHKRFGGRPNGVHGIECSASEAICLTPALLFKVLKETVLCESVDLDTITTIIFNSPKAPATYRGLFAISVHVDYEKEKITINGPRRRDGLAG